MILWSDVRRSMELHRRQAEARRQIEQIKRKQEEELEKLRIKHRINYTKIQREKE